ncbi:MAG: DUF4255 domain-containing protein [Oscillospiraceae bacterium]
MADFSIISDVSAALVKTLREALCPEPVQSPESIKLASPADKNADFQLGLFLYDLREMSEYRSSAQLRGADNRKTLPPRPLTLCYMLFLNSKAQIAAGAEAEQRILGRALQALSDQPMVSIAAAHPFGERADDDASLTFLNLSFEDKSKIWSTLSVPYQLGVFFNVSPVLLASAHSQPIVRVTDVEFTLNQPKMSQ